MPRSDEYSPNRGGESGQHGGAAAPIGIFASNGEFWTVGYRSATFSLRDVKGLSYIQQLLRKPGEEIHAQDLLTPPGTALDPGAAQIDEFALPFGVTVRPGLDSDAGEILDAQAKREYKRRLGELNEQLEDLLERGDHERVEKVESEIDSLRRAISYAIDRKGRDRRSGSNAERARLNVTRSIKAALQKVLEHDTEFGEILSRSIKTGLFCSCIPDPRAPVDWQFSLETADPVAEIPATEPLFSRREPSFFQAFTEGTEFVGRETERAALSRSLEQVIAGHGSVVLIGGPPGVGKTRMAAEIGAEAIRKGVLAYVGSCYDRENPIPFIPFVEIIESALAQA